VINNNSSDAGSPCAREKGDLKCSKKVEADVSLVVIWINKI